MRQRTAWALLSAWVTVAGVAAADAGPDAEVSPAPGADAGEIADNPEEVKALARQVERVRALLAEKLDVAVEPQSLFDVPLADENAIAVEIVRLERVLGALLRSEDG